jgi:NADPH:quinone reductase-like Zn-dependent oxidoreductase
LYEREVVRAPTHLDSVETATLPCAALTAWSALVEQGKVGPHDTVVIQGTGGVALFALQFAVLAGARVIITSSSDEKLERARAMGAHETINYRSNPEWGKKVLELTDGEGASQIVELGGGDTFVQSLKAIRPGGAVHMIGVLGGVQAPFNVLPVVMQNVRLQGVLVGPRQDFERMNAAIALHGLRPVVDRVVAFDEAAQALESFGKGGHFGKVAVRVGG